MSIYQQGRNSPGKWIFAGILFILAMTFSSAGVNAFNYPFTEGNSNGSNQPVPNVGAQQALVNRQVSTETQDPATPVPEPITLLLLAGGLGATLWNRKRSKA